MSSGCVWFISLPTHAINIASNVLISIKTFALLSEQMNGMNLNVTASQHRWLHIDYKDFVETTWWFTSVLSGYKHLLCSGWNSIKALQFEVWNVSRVQIGRMALVCNAYHQSHHEINFPLFHYFFSYLSVLVCLWRYCNYCVMSYDKLMCLRCYVMWPSRRCLFLCCWYSGRS